MEEKEPKHLHTARAVHSARHVFGKMSKTARTVTASVAVVAFAAAAAMGSFALAQDGAGDVAAQDGQQDVSWEAQADGTTDKTVEQLQQENGGNAAADSGAGADASVDSSTAAAAAQPVERGADNLPTTVAAGCDAVEDWTTLGTCLQTTGAVTITKTIDAAGDAPITIPAGVDIVLNAGTDANPALTSTAAGDGMLIVNGNLTIGKDKDDESFSYKDGKRWLALVNNGGSLTINSGTFSGVDTTGTGYANGGIVKVNTGAQTTVINNGMFSGNKAERGSVIYSDSENGISIHGGTFDGNSSNLAAGAIMQASTSATMTIDATSGTAPKFTNNTAGSMGGAIHNKGALVINAGEFTGNKAQANGGAISQDAAEASITINDGTFSGNATLSTDVNANNGHGGVIYQSAGTLVINKGTFSGNKAIRGGVVYSDSGATNTIAIHGGTFSGNSSTMAAGAFMSNNGHGTMTIDATSGDAPKFTNNTAGSQGGVIHNNGTLTINAGDFESNTANANGGAISQGGGAITVNPANGQKVTFSKNTTSGAGGAIYKTNGDLTITGGDFSENLAYGAGGGAIGQDGTGSTLVAPADGQQVKFTKNGHTVADGTVCNTDKGEMDKCNGGLGGGAIAGFAGKVNIQGDVLFDGNYSNRWGYMLGGGAVYVKGELWVQKGAEGKAPVFKNNYAGVKEPVKDANGKVTTAYRGGAGGAIFLNNGTVTCSTGGDVKQCATENKTYTSKAYIMAGDFENNTSGYLGGAIYTEADSLTYVAKAVAYANTAGHFGGGLWLCPSGTGTASKGGNIALFDNSVSNKIDPDQANGTKADGTAIPNTNNQEFYPNKGGTGTEAGDDFAMMNPYWKSNEGITSTNYQLMDTWFTDRSQKVVTWYWDGTPVKEASGFQDYFQDPEVQLNSNKWHGKDGGGTNLAVTRTGDRYNETETNTELSMTGDGDNDDHLHTLVLNYDSSDTGIKTGVALKAVVRSDNDKTDAKTSALVTLTGNSARLSGGAFATNGDVRFSTPYTASWTKVETINNNLTDTKIDGSAWLLTTTDKDGKGNLGGPYSPDFQPGMCLAGDDDSYSKGLCWKEETGADGVTTRSAIVKDNDGQSESYDGFDNNPTAGGFDINNLANGKYTMSEYTVPDGYAKDMVEQTNQDGTATKVQRTYSFDVANAQGIWGYEDKDNTKPIINQKIGNVPLGVEWDKVDSLDHSALLSGSSWTITKVKDADGKVIGKEQRQTYVVTDCADPANAKPADPKCADGKNTAPKDGNAGIYADKDGTAGKLRVQVGSAGTYVLKETAAPDRYWLPGDADYHYEFTLTDDATGPATIEKVTGADYADNAKVLVNPNSTDEKTTPKSDDDLLLDTATNRQSIANRAAQVSWSKVSAADPNGDKLTGSEWTVRGPLVKDANGKFADATEKDANGADQSIAVTAKVIDCVDAADVAEANKCAKQHNTATGDTTTYADTDGAAGQFTVRGLKVPPSEDVTYYYELTETKQPDGYVLPKGVTYTFAVNARQPGANGATDPNKDFAGQVKITTIAVGNDGQPSVDEKGNPVKVSQSLQVINPTTGTGADKKPTGENQIPNVGKVSTLPFTGGRAARDWAIVGGVFALGAGLAYALVTWYRNRKGLGL